MLERCLNLNLSFERSNDNNKFGIKGGSFGSVYDVLGVSESCLMMQLPACLVQESGHVYLFDWATSKLVMLYQDWPPCACYTRP
ncbi:hypothetical protein DY000_02007077 [Brassica cretica]|uniref:Uncharacterized protein n=1 Tax=Brassica cretica TaxID=69181 RepID=A0ABQ7C4Y4_BRACR|nr:hypothetical protein DY000_02007077 [Brassica cretica]